MARILSVRHKMDSNVQSAGEITFTDPICSGRSETLQVEATNADSDIVSMYDYLGGLVDVSI